MRLVREHRTRRQLVPALLVAVALVVVAGWTVGRPQPAEAWDNVTANTPPTGWNSYDAFNWGVKEADVKANADYLAASWSDAGLGEADR